MATQNNMSLDTRFRFGKYDGVTLEDVADSEPNYIEFMLDEELISLSPEAERALAERKII